MLEQLKHYAYLMRMDKPIGTFLLLWPTLWALWLAAAGQPTPSTVVIFVVGVFTMRSAGCIINDIADRHIDGQVKRTKNRPLVTGKVSLREALIVFSIMLLVALLLMLCLNRLTQLLAFVAVALAVFYPFSKRLTHFPQAILGLAFSWSIPMAFAAETQTVPALAWWLFAAAALWPIAYDTIYAMVDRDDDLAIGVKSTAVIFANYDKLIVHCLQAIMLALLALIGWLAHLSLAYYACLAVASGFFIYQAYLIKDRDREQCFRAFLNNNWFGLFVFIGFLLG